MKDPLNPIRNYLGFRFIRWEMRGRYLAIWDRCDWLLFDPRFGVLQVGLTCFNFGKDWEAKEVIKALSENL